MHKLDAPAPSISRSHSQHPLPGARLTSGFGKRQHPVQGGDDFHGGVDLAAAEGTSVRSPLDGVVAEVGKDPARGVFVVLQHPSSLTTRYHHLGDTDLQRGAAIRSGDVVGTTGNTGVSTGPHLHVEVLHHGQPIDPRRLFESSR